LLGAGLALLFAERLAEHAGGQSLYSMHWLALAALLVYVIAANRS
jgi:hypothetical protein